ncbi:MAG: TRAP transporter fused permease subunit [Mesorhizobium sp.]|nr:TRAP transporter fused permease subunit [Mesorhizobium sp.]
MSGKHQTELHQNGTSGAPLIRSCLAGSITVAAVLWSIDFFSRIGYALYTEQFLAYVLGASLALVFWQTARPSGGFARTLKAVDLILGSIGLVCGLYLSFRYPDLVAQQMRLPVDGLVVAAFLFCLVLEGLRRAVGIALVVVVLATVGYGLIGHLTSGPLQTREVQPARLLIYLSLDSNALLGITMSVAATIVVAFVLFGQMLLRSGGAEFFNDLALALMGRARGGAGKIAIIASSLFGTISGVVVSNIVATGVVTIRLMKSGGFRPQTAAAIEAVASTGGQIMPPVMGAVAFLMADFLQIPYSAVVIAALVPALLYYVALFIQVDLEAAKHQIAKIDESLIPPLAEVMRTGWICAIPFVVLITALFHFNVRPETAAIYAVLSILPGGLLIGYKSKRMTVRDIVNAIVETGTSIVDIIMISAAAGLIIGTLNLTGLGFVLTYSLVQLGDGNVVLLLLVAAVVCIVLGMGMPTVGVYLLLAILVAPSLIEVGIEPIAAHLFIFYLGMMSMVTPPIAVGSFFAANIAKSPPMATAFTSMRLGWTAYVVPFLFVFTPGLLLNGTWSENAFAIIYALVGITGISVAFAGYAFRRLTVTSRLLFLGSGSLALIPAAALADLWAWLPAVGASVFFCIALLEWKADRPHARPEHFGDRRNNEENS